jgi:hypothetical protein
MAMKTEAKSLLFRVASRMDSRRRRMEANGFVKPELVGMWKSPRDLAGYRCFARRARERAQQHHHHHG